jgi:hypothetical protein
MLDARPDYSCKHRGKMRKMPMTVNQDKIGINKVVD